MPTLDRLAETGLRYNNFKVPSAVFAQPHGLAYRPQQP